MSDARHYLTNNRNMDEWDSIVRPVIERLFRFIEDYIEGVDNSHTEFFSLADAVDVYTAFYNFTSDKRFEHADLTSLYQEELRMFQDFIRDRFEMRSLEGILRHYRAFRMMEKWFLCFFHHLNRSYAQIVGRDVPAKQAFTRIFVYEFFANHMNIMSNILYNAYKTDRYTDTLRAVVRVVLAVYPESEPTLFGLFCDVSRAYFREEKTRMEGGERVLYMDVAMMMMQREKIWVEECFPAGRWDEIYTIFREEVIEPVFLEFIDSDDAGWKLHPSVADAFEFYRHGDHKILVERYVDSIRSSAPSLTPDVVGWIVGLYSQQKKTIHHILTQEDPRLIAEFRRALASSVAHIFEIHPTMTHHLIRRFDRAMRKKEDVLPYVCLFEYCPNKDTLNEQYKKALSARILESGASLGEELHVLSVMRETMGSGYIMSMTNMITDVREKTYRDGNLSVSVVSRADWITTGSARSDIWIPSDIRGRIEAIERDYIGEKTSMRLEMSPLFGQVVLLGTYGTRRYEMSMSPLQASVILLLSEKGGVSADDLVFHFGGDREMLARVVDSLTIGERPLLVEIDQEWRLSPVFVASTRRIRLPPVSSSAKEKDFIHPTAVGDPNAIDAAIVRLMKARRSIHHPDLVVAVGKTIRCVDVRSIKSRIVSLIDREYLSRDPSDNSLYHYIP